MNQAHHHPLPQVVTERSSDRMDPRRPLTAGERHFSRLFLGLFFGGIPAFFIGFYAGMFASDIGFHLDLASIFARTFICATPAILLATIAPRRWLLLSVIYLCGFHAGYTVLDGLGAAMQTLVALPIAALTGERIGTPSPPTHPELPLIFSITLGCGAFISFLRCRQTKPDAAPESAPHSHES
jgi:hypothetical protein